jgi:hypothetical protein
MSLLATTLALLTLPAARHEDRDDLAIELKQARDEIETLKAECNALQAEVTRLWRMADQLRERSYQRYDAQQAIMAQHMAMAQYAQVAQMQNSYQGLAQSQNMLGAQNFDPERFCNCVPARHDAFIRGTQTE